VIIQVLTLVAYGCPVPAIVAAFGFQARTVRAWGQAAGGHCERVHQQQVQQPRLLGQVQADELRAKVQGQVLWLAMAIAVPARLWLGGVVSAHRDTALIRTLAERVRTCLQEGPLLVCADGLAAYLGAFRRALRSRRPTGRCGRPRLVAWEAVVLGQVVKRCEGRRVVEVLRQVAVGTWERAQELLTRTQGQGVLNTAYIERLNATFRARLALLCRRTRQLGRKPEWLHAAVYLLGTVYNFCSTHASLMLPEGTPRTPAMAAGITDHPWSMAELLWHRVPPPPWRPPKRRGPRPRAIQRLVDQWCT
jgi:hypothetical protein